eukprot:symbB.v1.2.003695.t1/scaffold206.1/size269131/2
MLHPEMDDGIFLNEGHRDVMPGMRPRRCAKRVVHRIRLDLEVVTGLWGPRPSQTRGNQWCLQIMGLGQDFARRPSGTVKDRSFLARFFTTSRACAYGSRINN